MSKIKETDLAKQLISSFNGSNYEIYQEVTTPNGTADIVLKYSFIWSIEVKLGMNLTVIAQARFNQRYFHYSSICIPWKARAGKTFNTGLEICRNFGIGIFSVASRGNVDEILKARLNRNALVKKIFLHERMKTYAEAGNSKGERWTPFNQTVDDLKRYVRQNPGCRLKTALQEIDHHYHTLSSATSSIRQWINTGVIKGLELKQGILNEINEI